MLIQRIFNFRGLTEKLGEAVAAVVPVMAIVLILTAAIVPMPTSILLAFYFGGVMVIFGMTLFTLGAENAMGPMGSNMGTVLTGTKKLWLIIAVGFALGFIITVSEPDLQVLADQVQSIPTNVLIYSVALGTGLFLVVALLKTFLKISLRILLLVFYALIFILLIFAPDDFTAVAFDSGGVTTGPMTVPFIMAFGVGISAFRNDKSAKDDSFGIISLCSVGPIMAVLILSIIYRPEDAAYAEALVPDISDSMELSAFFFDAIPAYMKEIAVSLLPIVVFFFIFALISRRPEKSELFKITVGLGNTYLGLVIFLTGVNVGFMPAGSCLGSLLARLPYNWIIIPVGMVIGFFIVRAEPAVYVLSHQVEEITSGAVSGRLLVRTLSFGVAISIGLSLLRVLTGISILWFIIPGYALAVAMSFKASPMFVGIAFDSGGVASGPMTATFLLPFAMGACIELGGNVVTDAFGVVAMVALTPLIAIQMLSLIFSKKEKSEGPAVQSSAYNNYVIIDL